MNGKFSNDILSKVKNTISIYNMFNQETPIVVGVSGGPDSMALLDILAKIYPDNLVVAHLDHQFRGDEAREDAKFVKRESEKRGIPVELGEYDVPLFIKETGMGAQEAARTIRYQFYQDVANKWNSKQLALGHHANDQAETILMRLIRGTGIHGLSGIPYSRNWDTIQIFRPLLDLTRQEIEQYCIENNIDYRIDKSNFATKYTRNEIRLNALPFLEKYNPKFVEHLHQFGKIVQDENSYLEGVAEQFLEQNIEERTTTTIKLNVLTLQSLHIALQRRIIHLILRYLNLHKELSFIHIEGIISLLKHSHPSKSIDLPGIRVFRNYEQIVFNIVENNNSEPFFYNVRIPGEVTLQAVNKKVEVFLTDSNIKLNGLWAVFDYDQLSNNELIIRSRKNGDRIELLGTEGSKKLKDIFIDQKIPRNERELTPIVEQDGKILWVPGIKRSSYALVSNNTKRFVYIVLTDIF